MIMLLIVNSRHYETHADQVRLARRYPRYANAPAHRYAKWAMEVARFSFTPTTADVIRAATPLR